MQEETAGKEKESGVESLEEGNRNQGTLGGKELKNCVANRRG